MFTGHVGCMFVAIGFPILKRQELERTVVVLAICFVLVTSFATTRIWKDFRQMKSFFPCVYKGKVYVHREKP